MTRWPSLIFEEIILLINYKYKYNTTLTMNTSTFILDINKKNFTMTEKTLFIMWLIGFLDAEGNVQIFPKKRTDTLGNITHYGVGYGFYLGLNLRDLQLLKFIQRMLNNIGKIYIYEEKEEAHYAITKKAELLWFIGYVFAGYTLKTVHSFTRFEIMKYVLTNTIIKVKNLEDYKKLTQSSLNNIKVYTNNTTFSKLWVGGFANGEGSFVCTERKGGFIQFSFCIEHTDEKA